MWINRYATVLAVCTFLLLISGGLVSVMEAGMACGFDWPLCEGQYFPQLVDGKQYEHPHRLTAMVVGLLTLGLFALLLRFRRTDRKLVRLGILAVVLVIAQALLGRLTVRMALPPWVSSVHQATAMAFFCLAVSLAFVVRQRNGGARSLSPVTRIRGRSSVLLMVGLTYAQVVAGAVMRHTRGGLACGFEFPSCLGAFWPEGNLSLHAHMVHRLLGIVVALATVAVALRVRKFGRDIGRISIALMVGVFAQVALGVLTIFTSRDILMMTLHSSLGAALLAGWVSVYWLAFPEAPTTAQAIRVPAGRAASLEPA
jgi:cytochrome c oxidase assembly protein subunit 15